MRCAAQIRAHGEAVPATAELRDGRLHVALDAPVRGVAPGQSVALYDGDRVVGQATIG
jgi:tRNA-specific 2-thiouridylase